MSRGAAGPGKAPVIAVYNLGDKALSGVQLGLPVDYPLGAQRELLAGVTAAEVTSANRASYPLPTLPPRSALWLTAATAGTSGRTASPER